MIDEDICNWNRYHALLNIYKLWNHVLGTSDTKRNCIALLMWGRESDMSLKQAQDALHDPQSGDGWAHPKCSQSQWIKSGWQNPCGITVMIEVKG